MTVSNTQVRKMMKELEKTGSVSESAIRAGIDRKTARKYRDLGQLPSDRRKVRGYRTRADVFAEDWAWVTARIAESPAFEAKTLFEMLQERSPDRYTAGQLRTLQRKLRQYRAAHGPDKEVFFAQVHVPGEAMQTDFTSAIELGITLCGERFPHMLCVSVLPFSNWQQATVVQSESLLSIRSGIQRALFALGAVPAWHQTDNSTAATHVLASKAAALRETSSESPQTHRATENREFHADYLEVMAHFGMQARTIAVGKKEQNGDVEASNGALKRALRQALLTRGSTDFENQDTYQVFVDTVTRRRNVGRKEKLEVELAAMKPLPERRMMEFSTLRLRVSKHSTLRIKHGTYSVPSRLIGEWVQVRLFETKVEVWHGDTMQFCCERLIGQSPARIDYRDVIWSLVRKPGAFARYAYRNAFFPSLVFRKSYDVLSSETPGIKADAEYLRILHLAATTMETEVEAALSLLLEQKHTIRALAVRSLIQKQETPVPALMAYSVDLSAYDTLVPALDTVRRDVASMPLLEVGS